MNATQISKGRNESERIAIRGLEADISLAKFRAGKHLAAGRALQADIQDDIATSKQIELTRYLASLTVSA